MAAALLCSLAVSQLQARQSGKVDVEPPGPTGIATPAQAVLPDRGRDTAYSHPPRAVTPIIAPIPFYNPQIEFGLDVSLMLVHRVTSDTSVQPSTGLATALATTNGTWGVGVGEFARFAGDRWRLQALLGYFDLNYSFYGTGQENGEAGTSVELNQPVFIFRGIGYRRLASSFYVGLGIQAASVKVSTAEDLASLPPELNAALREGEKVVEVALLPSFLVDSRDEQYFPTRGVNIDGVAQLFSESLGSDSTFQVVEVNAAWYHGWASGRQVVALGGNVCAAGGDIPVGQFCALGNMRGLRGYQNGRYQDRAMISGQAEYRRMLGRLGFALFVGGGTVAPGFGELSLDNVLVAGGVGVRYRLSKKIPVNYRVDFAYGSDGSAWYVSFTEAF